MTDICHACGLPYTTITSAHEQTECPACRNRSGSDNERGIEMDAEERDAGGLLSNWALAQDALLDAGCDCGTDEPTTCLMCRCRAALDEERDRVVGAESKAAVYKNDWVAAKAEFGKSMNTLRALWREEQAVIREIEEAAERAGYDTSDECLVADWIEKMRFERDMAAEEMAEARSLMRDVQEDFHGKAILLPARYLAFCNDSEDER